VSALAALLLITPAFVFAVPPLAVLPLAVQPPGGGAEAAAIDAGIRAGLEELGLYKVQPADLTLTHVRSATDMGVTCSPTDSFCVRKLAVLAEAKLVIAPRIADGTLTLRLLDVTQTGDGVEASRPLGDNAQRSAREALRLLNDPKSGDGTLTLDVTPAGAVVTLDGEVLGTAPLAAPLTGLSPGPHTVSAQLDGHAPGELSVDLGFGEEKTATLQLTGVEEAPPAAEPAPTTTPTEPAPEPGGLGVLATTGLVIAGVGGAVLALGVAGAATGEVLFGSELKKLEAADGSGSVDDANLLQTSAQVGWLVALAAGGVVAVGGVLFGVAVLTE